MTARFLRRILIAIQFLQPILSHLEALRSYELMIRRTAAFFLSFGLCLAIPLMAHAEDLSGDRELVELTDEQVSLNAAGVEALIEENPARAVAFLTDAYRIEPVNILALNLGRAYQFLGQCDRARQKLEQVSELPVVDSPPASRVDQRAQEYLLEVEENCIDDEPADIEAPDVDEQPSVDEDKPLPDSLTSPPPPQGNKRLMIPVLAGTGLLAAGTIFHLMARSERSQVTDFEGPINTQITQSEAIDAQHRANRYDGLALISVIGGALFVGVGGYFFLNRVPSHSYDSTTLDLRIDGDIRGISVHRRF